MRMKIPQIIEELEAVRDGFLEDGGCVPVCILEAIRVLNEKKKDENWLGHKVRIKRYSELKDCDWFVEDMKPYCGRIFRVSYDYGDYVEIHGWEWSKDSIELVEEGGEE